MGASTLVWIRRKFQPLLLFNFQSFAKKHLLPPPTLCHLTFFWECVEVGSLEAKRKKIIQWSASLWHWQLTQAKTTERAGACASSRKHQLHFTCLCECSNLSHVGNCSWQYFVLFWETGTHLEIHIIVCMQREPLYLHAVLSVRGGQVSVFCPHCVWFGELRQKWERSRKGVARV